MITNDDSVPLPFLSLYPSTPVGRNGQNRIGDTICVVCTYEPSYQNRARARLMEAVLRQAGRMTRTQRVDLTGDVLF